MSTTSGTGGMRVNDGDERQALLIEAAAAQVETQRCIRPDLYVLALINTAAAVGCAVAGVVSRDQPSSRENPFGLWGLYGFAGIFGINALHGWFSIFRTRVQVKKESQREQQYLNALHEIANYLVNDTPMSRIGFDRNSATTVWSRIQGAARQRSSRAASAAAVSSKEREAIQLLTEIKTALGAEIKALKRAVQNKDPAISNDSILEDYQFNDGEINTLWQDIDLLLRKKNALLQQKEEEFFDRCITRLSDLFPDEDFQRRAKWDTLQAIFTRIEVEVKKPKLGNQADDLSEVQRQLETARREIEHAGERYSALEEKVDRETKRLNGEIKRVEAELAREREQYSSLERKSSQAEERLRGERTSDLEAAAIEKRRVEASLDELRREKEATGERHATALRDLQRAKDDAERTHERALRDLQGQLEGVRRDLTEAQRKNREDVAQIGELEKGLRQAEEAHESAAGDFSSREEVLLGQIRSLKETLREKKRALQASRTMQANIQEWVDSLKEELEKIPPFLSGDGGLSTLNLPTMDHPLYQLIEAFNASAIQIYRQRHGSGTPSSRASSAASSRNTTPFASPARGGGGGSSNNGPPTSPGTGSLLKAFGTGGD